MLLCKKVITFFIILVGIQCGQLCAYVDKQVDKSIAIETQNIHPLNILFIVGYFPCRSQIFILNIMTALIDKGHKVSILAR